MRVALYARVSTERQEQLGTVASQLEALRAAATRDELQVIEEFVDAGHSGARLDRPALDRLRDAAQAGLFEQVLVLAADRLARSYAYQVLILEELERFGVRVRFLEGPALTDDPQARLLVQMQGVIAEYERAKITERYRRGRLHRARQGNPVSWRVPYGYRRIAGEHGAFARVEVLEREAAIVRDIFHAHADEGLTLRQIAKRLYEHGIASPTGKPTWKSSTMSGLIRNRAYIGTIYCNRLETLHVPDPNHARRRKTITRERPQEEWIAIPVPAIIDTDLFSRAQRASRDNSKFNPRGAHSGRYLLRGLIQCGHCHAACTCHTMPTRNGSKNHYYYCSNHDVITAGGRDALCPERNIRSDALDAFVFEQVRLALLHPQQLTDGERELTLRTPAGADELVDLQLQRLERRLSHAQQERSRLLDAYQADLITLDELTRRSNTIASRHDELTRERDTLQQKRSELAQQKHLQHAIATFARRVSSNIDRLDFDARQKLLRLVIDKVTVTGWRVEIHLKIPINPDPTSNEPRTHDTQPETPHPSSDMGLRSARHGHGHRLQQRREQADPPRRR
jgi:site-specific DNA recombinase